MKVAIVYHSETGNTERMAELVREGAERVEGVEARIMSVDAPDANFINEAKVLVLGCPTYMGAPSWQMKRFMDTAKIEAAGKLGGVFASQNWPGGGGADFTEMTLIAGMLVRGMLIFSGGITLGTPYLHFGAVSARRPTGLYEERCLKLGQTLASKAIELFGQ